MQDFKKLRVYQDAYELSKSVFEEVKELKHYRVKEQLVASSTATCANLAELGSFDSPNQMLQKIRTCIGEANETEFWLDYLRDTNLIAKDNCTNLINKNIAVRKQLLALFNSLKTQNPQLKTEPISKR